MLTLKISTMQVNGSAEAQLLGLEFLFGTSFRPVPYVTLGDMFMLLVIENLLKSGVSSKLGLTPFL